VVSSHDLLERGHVPHCGLGHDRGRDVIGCERISHTTQMIHHGELSQPVGCQSAGHTGRLEVERVSLPTRP
jgi:hypothetical protein